MVKRKKSQTGKKSKKKEVFHYFPIRQKKEWTFPLPPDVVKEIFYFAGLPTACSMNRICLDLYHLTDRDFNWRKAFAVSVNLPIESLDVSDPYVWKIMCFAKSVSDPHKLFRLEQRKDTEKMGTSALKEMSKKINDLMNKMVLQRKLRESAVPKWMVHNTMLGQALFVETENIIDDTRSTTSFIGSACWDLVSLNGHYLRFYFEFEFYNDDDVQMAEYLIAKCRIKFPDGEIQLFEFESEEQIEEGGEEEFKRLVDLMANRSEDRRKITPRIIKLYVQTIFHGYFKNEYQDLMIMHHIDDVWPDCYLD